MGRQLAAAERVYDRADPEGAPGWLAFLIPALLPIIPTVFLQGTMLHFYLGVLLLVFLVVMLVAGAIRIQAAA